MSNRIVAVTNHNGNEIETLLSTFINDKIASYREPIRKGRKRGEKIGLSKKKYNVTLLFMLKKSLQEVSAKIGVSYGVIGVWRTEPEFQSTINRHYQEFAKLFLYRVQERVLKQDKILSENLQQPIEKLAPAPHYLPDNEFEDLKFYNPLLITVISEEALLFIEATLKVNPEITIPTMIELLNIFDSLPSGDMGKKVKVMREELRTKWILSMLRDIRNKLMGPMSEEDCKEAVVVLSSIIESYTTIEDH